MLQKNIIEGVYKNVHYKIYPNINNDYNFPEEKNPIIFLLLKHSVILNMVYDHTYQHEYLLGDGVFTNKKNLSLIIDSRDCMNVIIVGNNFCGIVHMSWKNLYLGIIDKMFQLFQKENINQKILKFIILPNITLMEVKNNFIEIWQENEKYKSYLKDENIFVNKNNKKYFHIVNFFKEYTSIEYNIQKTQIINIPINTYENLNFSSLRRDGLDSNLSNKFIIYME
jgi:copper oxidase (laccase) domain-containing protein